MATNVLSIVPKKHLMIVIAPGTQSRRKDHSGWQETSKNST